MPELAPDSNARSRFWMTVVLLLLSTAAPAGLAKEPPLKSYGAISLGHPSAGLLINGQRLPPSEHWIATAPAHAYATEETIEQLSHCIRRVRNNLPNSPPVRLGSLSGKGGGKIPPHDSHRTGRDVDVYFFRTKGAVWHEKASRADIDFPRTWALLRCFITDADVDFVLIDKERQGWLEQYALEAGEPADWVASVFHDDPQPWSPSANRAVVRHAPGHVAHMHVRFVSARARRLGAQLYDRLVREGVVKGKYSALSHRVVRGDTLSGLAHRYRVPVAQLKKLNHLSSSLLRVGQRLTIRHSVALRGVKDPVHVPKRHTPPVTASAGARVAHPR